MLKINIKTSLEWLTYFKNKLNKKTDIDVIIKDSNNLKNKIIKQYNNKKIFLYSKLNNFFWDFNENIIIEVYPEYFYLWAINTSNWVIVLWQPSFCNNYYIWLIWHEISHFLLKKHNLNRFIEEIICFCIEKQIIEELDGIDTIDFIYYKNIDSFHLDAILYSHKYYSEFKKLDLGEFISFLDNNLPDKFKNIDISKNLIAYLKENG